MPIRLTFAVMRWLLRRILGDRPWVSLFERALPQSAPDTKGDSRMFLPTHRSRHQVFRPGPMFMLFMLVESCFWGMAATCFLFAMHRIATALRTEARISALRKMGDAYTDEEREVLIHKIKRRTLGCI
jgi:hypothetical protein